MYGQATEDLCNQHLLQPAANSLDYSIHQTPLKIHLSRNIFWYFAAEKKIAHGHCLFLFLSDIILYVATHLHFRWNNSIMAAKACISKPALFVWKIYIIKLCLTAEGPRRFEALSRLQNKIYIHFQTRTLPQQQDVFIVFSWKCLITTQCHFIIKYKGRVYWDFAHVSALSSVLWCHCQWWRSRRMFLILTSDWI